MALAKVAQLEDSRTERTERLQVFISSEAIVRLRVMAALRDCDRGKVVSELLEKHLPPPPTEAPSIR